MANTYTKIHIHVICVVKYRRKLIAPEWEDELYKYITGIIQNHEHKVIQINGMPDHTHILIGFRPKRSLSKLVQTVKGKSALWINQKKFCTSRFRWQSGFAAFSISTSHIRRVARYIEYQKEHHRQQPLKTEYFKMLNENKIDFEEKFAFDELSPEKS